MTIVADRLGAPASGALAGGAEGSQALTLTREDIAALSTDQLDAIFFERRRRHEARSVDPELRDCVLRRTDEAEKDGRVTSAEAEEIRHQLDQMAPAAVLDGWWRQLIRNRPMGFPRRERVVDPTPAEWLADDPDRLRGVLLEMGRFCTDEAKIVSAAADLAARVGIPDDVAERVLIDGLGELRRSWAASNVG